MVPQEYADQLAATRGQLASERRLVTILFTDVKGSTAMAETRDPEDVMEIMSGAFERLIEPIVRHEGTVARLMGDAVLAFFGAPLSHEDDPERALRAALEIVARAGDYASQLEAERGLSGFNVRVGINTGLVVVGEVGSDLRVEYTAMGDAINLASRLEQNAPPGGILISHDTYRLVRGAFDLAAQQPLTVKGRAAPVLTYLVERARPWAFRRTGRGVQGVETRMVGRQAETELLQAAVRTVIDRRQCRVVTVVGEAGVGKSRLLDEFDLWAQDQPQDFVHFKGRVDRQMQHQPHALLRSLFSFHFAIQDSDPSGVARDSLVRGLMPGFQADQSSSEAQVEMKAHIIGQLLGFDFSASPHVQDIGQDAQQLRDRALIYIGDYFRARAAEHPVLLTLEDLHWADDSSLEAVERLAASLSMGVAGASPVLILCAARPSLYERRPDWGSRQEFHSRLDLVPLTNEHSRDLVEQILQRMHEVPPPLRDLVVSGAEGNPFFLEELVKMLIEEGVILVERTAWSVDTDRLGDLQVPPSLTGVLQARLDRLPFDQRQVLQQASVIGRLFWDLAVAYIAARAQTEPDSQQVSQVLASLQRREMVFHQDPSAIEGADEFLFKHAMLREVTYEGVLKRLRRTYHGLAADWMMAQAAERESEYLGTLAEHLALAGRTGEALVYLRRAAERAAAAYANAEAIAYYSQALELTPQDDAEERYTILLARVRLFELQGTMAERSRDIEELEELARALDAAESQMGRSRRAEAALRRSAYDAASGNYEAALVDAQAAVRLAHEVRDITAEAKARRMSGMMLMNQGEVEEALQQFEHALALAQECGARDVEAECLGGLGYLASEYHIGDWDMITCREQSLEIYREIGDRRGEGLALYRLASLLAEGGGSMQPAKAFCDQALAINRDVGNRVAESSSLYSLARIQMAEDDFAGARVSFEQALAIQRELGRPLLQANIQQWLGYILAAQGFYAQGQSHHRQALRVMSETGDRHPKGWPLWTLGLLHFWQGDYTKALTLFDESLHISRELGPGWLVSHSLMALGLVSHTQGDNESAHSHAQQALETGYAEWLLGHGDVALVLGHALAGLGDEAGAIASYRQALDRYRRSGYLNPPMEAHAGLARLALVQGDESQALEHTEAILYHLQDHTLDGTFEPFRVYLTCFKVLEANEDPRAAEVLRTSCQLLQARAAGIEEEQLRQSFLEGVPYHRELLREGSRVGLVG